MYSLMIALFFQWFCTLLNCFFFGQITQVCYFLMFADSCRPVPLPRFFADLCHFCFWRSTILAMTTSCSSLLLLLFCVVIFFANMFAAVAGMIDAIIASCCYFCCYVC